MKSVRSMLIAAVMVASPLAFAEPPPGASSCLGCHPAKAGNGPVPTLSGRKPAEIITAMQGFRGGTLKGTVMDRIAKGFSDEEVRAIAEWYAKSRP